MFEKHEEMRASKIKGKRGGKLFDISPDVALCVGCIDCVALHFWGEKLNSRPHKRDVMHHRHNRGYFCLLHEKYSPQLLEARAAGGRFVKQNNLPGSGNSECPHHHPPP